MDPKTLAFLQRILERAQDKCELRIKHYTPASLFRLEGLKEELIEVKAAKLELMHLYLYYEAH